MSPSTTPGAAPRLMPLINAFMASRLVHVAAELAIADRLVDGAKSSEALARETKTHWPSLHRLLRALASLGVLEEVETNQFALTAMGAQLRSGAPDSVRNLALMFGSERTWRLWGALLGSVQTGESAMQRLYGVGSFEYFVTHAQEAAIFNAAMAEATRQLAHAVTAAYDFTPLHFLVDVGGGSGILIAEILAAAPGLNGIVFDLPSGSSEALRHLEAAGVADRCEVIAGDFFRSVPEGADAYVLKSIIHDWDDERSVAILKNCRNAMSSRSIILLVEQIMPTRMTASAGLQRMALLDLHMLVGPGGRERSEGEYQALLTAAGLAWTRTLPLPGDIGSSLIEGRPA
jgi:orsellinic acid C2-O-methyltransferase